MSLFPFLLYNISASRVLMGPMRISNIKKYQHWKFQCRYLAVIASILPLRSFCICCSFSLQCCITLSSSVATSRLQVVYIYIALAPMWSIAHPQFSSTGLCLGLGVQFGSIVDLFAAVLVRLIFSSCFLVFHDFSFLEGSRRVPF